MTEILVAPVASALKLKEELEKEKALRREAEEKLEKEKALRREAEEKWEKEKALRREAEEKSEVHTSVEKARTTEVDKEKKVSLYLRRNSCGLTEEEKLSSIEKMRMRSDVPEKGVTHIKKVMENPTFTVLYRERRHIPTESPLGKGDKPKCKLYPDVFRREGMCGTAYIRWEQNGLVYYIAGLEKEGDAVVFEVPKEEITLRDSLKGNLKSHKKLRKRDPRYKRLTDISLSLYEAIGF